MIRRRISWAPEKSRFAKTPEIQIRPHEGSDFTVHLAVTGSNETEGNQALTYLSNLLDAGARALRDVGPDTTSSVAGEGLIEIGLGVDEIIKGSGW